MKTLKKLFEPIRIGPLEIKNRIAFAPTHVGFATDMGQVTDQVLCHYAARAKGGTGLIIVEGTGMTGKYAFSIQHGLALHSDRQINGFKELADTIHACDSKAVVQIALGQGGQALRGHPRRELVAPSPMITKIDKGVAPKSLKVFDGVVGEMPRELTTDEIVALEDQFAAAAGRALKAGFDGIEIHGAHGYLIGSFVSPFSNKRNDEYGGSVEKRLTLPLNIIRKVRQQVGPKFILGYRISGDEHVPGGQTAEDTAKIASCLEQEGIDYIHLSSGRYESINWTFPPEEGVMLPEASIIKKAIKIPLICPNIHDPDTGEEAINEETVEMIALSRALLADPAWANKAKEGTIEEITRCVFCNSCMNLVFQGFSARCTVNPDFGRERFIPEYYPPPWKRASAKARN